MPHIEPRTPKQNWPHLILSHPNSQLVLPLNNQEDAPDGFITQMRTKKILAPMPVPGNADGYIISQLVLPL